MRERERERERFESITYPVGGLRLNGFLKKTCSRKQKYVVVLKEYSFIVRVVGVCETGGGGVVREVVTVLIL